MWLPWPSFAARKPAKTDWTRRPEKVVSDYAYVMQFDADNISHMTKIWNDIKAIRALFWA